MMTTKIEIELDEITAGFLQAAITQAFAMMEGNIYIMMEAGHILQGWGAAFHLDVESLYKDNPNYKAGTDKELENTYAPEGLADKRRNELKKIAEQLTQLAKTAGKSPRVASNLD